jgi:flagellar basal-body rod protein FlgG
MMKGIYVAASGSLAIERQMDNITNNLANANSAGFKKDIAVFQSLPLEKRNPSSGTGLPNPLTFTYVAKSPTDYAQGALVKTGNKMDVALEGPGFFAIQDGTERRYVRTLSLSVTPAGDLQTKNGAKIIDVSNNRPVQNLSEGELHISPDGTISQDGNAVGRLKVVDFPTPYPLRKIGGSMYSPLGRITPKEAKNTSVLQGMVEKPNVSVVREMTQMINAVRGYEAYQKVITSMDSLAGKAVNDLGRIG